MQMSLICLSQNTPVKIFSLTLLFILYNDFYILSYVIISCHTKMLKGKINGKQNLNRAQNPFSHPLTKG